MSGETVLIIIGLIIGILCLIFIELQLKKEREAFIKNIEKKARCIK